MADHGEVALRMLNPQWTTLHGTVRQWNHHGRIRRRLEASGGGAASVMVFGTGGDGVPTQAPEEIETIMRFWIERGGRSRFEHLAADGEVQHTVIDDGGSVLMVPAEGPVTRADRSQHGSSGTWTGDPRFLTGNVRLRFGQDEVIAGRAAVRVEPVPASDEQDVLSGRASGLEGRLVGGSGGYGIVDVASGLLLRYEGRDDDGRPFSRQEFVTIQVDEPFADEVFAFEVPPERAEGTPTDVQLEMLEREGVDMSGLDRDDPEAVRIALEEHIRSRHGQMGPGRSFRPRSLADVTAPLGPPPADADAATAGIEQALLGLAPQDDAPMARRFERGEVLDAAVRSGLRPSPPEWVEQHAEPAVLTDVVFVREDEAVVRFDIPFQGSRYGQQGRAVRIDGRWLLSYDTVARLFVHAGWEVPSLLDPPEAGSDEEPG